MSGVVGTAAWMVLVAGLVWWKHADLGHMSLNERGDFLAGVVAPVVFLWLVLGYLQQGEELRSNTETLQLQQRALQQQVEGTLALVRNAEQQTKAAVARLELEQAKWERRLVEAKARTQPVFVFTGGETQAANHTMQYKNTGGRAKHLTTVSGYPPSNVNVTFAPQDLIESGGRGTISIGPLTSFPTKLTIAYVDEDGDEGQMQLEVFQPGMFRVV